MTSRKKTPDTSKIVRSTALGYTRTKPGESSTPAITTREPSDTNFGVAKTDKADPKADVKKPDAPKPGDGPKSAVANAAPTTVEPAHAPITPAAPEESGAPKAGEGPKAATQNELPTEPARARAATVAMPALAPVGMPPDLPTVENPTNMPAARQIPDGNPTDPALPPGRVPPGDSRSLRKGAEFALVYRQGTFVISRFGMVGQRGQWRVVEYPTSASASHSYAKECSRFVAEGFSDYRD